MKMTMRAKFRVIKIETFPEHQQQVLHMSAVSHQPFDKDGVSEDNSFARWTPSGELKMVITNPKLKSALKEGEAYYLDFTKAE